MTAPNLIALNNINGRTTATNITTTTVVTLLSNAASSNHVYKINTLNVANTSSSAAVVTVSWYTGANAGGNAFAFVGSVTVPSNSTLNVLDKGTQYYLEENTSIGVVAGTAYALIASASYEDCN